MNEPQVALPESSVPGEPAGTARALSPSAGGASPAGFPLPLVPFERYLLLDDSPRYPMTFSGEFTFRGRMDRGLLAEALARVLPRHPLLQAVVQDSKSGPLWVPASHAVLPLQDWPEGSGERFHPEPLDVRQRPGVRIVCREEERGTHAVWEFHHVSCDGQGGMRFVEDLLLAYGALVQGAPPHAVLVPLCGQPLERRAEFAPGQPRQGSAWEQAWQRLREAWAFHTQRIMPLALPRRQPLPQPGIPYPGTLTHLLSEAESAQIKARVRQADATLNDVGLALLFETIAAWNRGRQQLDERKWIRILFPVDLRGRADRHAPAANRTGFCFLARRTAALADPARLLAGIREETAFMKRTRMGLDFLYALGAVQQVPGLLPLILKVQGCQATAVLTNLADPTRFLRHSVERESGQLRIGNLRLEQITGSSTIRPLTHANFGLGHFGGRQIFTLRADPWYFTADEAGGLLRDYVQAFLRWAAG